MSTDESTKYLELIPANRSFIQKLYAYGKISKEAREYALNLLYPHEQWGLWISRLLLILGCPFIIASIAYFFAFNWQGFTPLSKLISLEIGIALCIIGACLLSLQKLSGQMLLLSGSALVGVFIAVFGNIYEIASPDYQLFLIWSLLTSVWTVFSNFSSQWIFWLTISNIFIYLHGEPKSYTIAPDLMGFVYMSIFNGVFLVLREYLVAKKAYVWLAARWIPTVLTLGALIPLLFPIISWIIEARVAIALSVFLGSIAYVLIGLFCYYKIRDMWSMAVVVLSSCLILEVLGIQILFEIFKHQNGVDVVMFVFLVIGIMTLSICLLGVKLLAKLSKALRVKNV